MKLIHPISSSLTIAAMSVLGALMPALSALAHCDTMSGPLVTEAVSALDKGDVTPVLKWVQPPDEAAIRKAFSSTVAVRAKGAEEKALADRFFLETLVRIHRAGEGAPFTGLKESPPEPVVAMADAALTKGSADDMIRKISSHMARAMEEKFERALKAAKSKDASVEAGRDFVEAYVAYMHYVEGVHDAIVRASSHHGSSDAHSSGHRE